LFLILDDTESLQRGKFRTELMLLCDLFRLEGWRAEFGWPAQAQWTGRQLLFYWHSVSFIVTRSTNFSRQSEDISSLRRAYEAGRIYVTPNPFSYATRNDKRLLEWLSLSHWDQDLGIQFAERQIMSAHMPETFGARRQHRNLVEGGTILCLSPFMDCRAGATSIVRPWGGRVYGVSRSVARATWRKDGFRNLA
jgi:hypothetical protein